MLAGKTNLKAEFSMADNLFNLRRFDDGSRTKRSLLGPAAALIETCRDGSPEEICHDR
jgi:hypothetical protein